MSVATETLDDLLRPVIDSEGLTSWAHKNYLHPFTLYRLRRGRWKRAPHATTIRQIARGLRVSVERVEAAVKRSRK